MLRETRTPTISMRQDELFPEFTPSEANLPVEPAADEAPTFASTGLLADGHNSATAKSGDEYQVIPLDQILPPSFQPRLLIEPDAIAELSESIRTYGVQQPILVRRATVGYELIAGSRRRKAAELAGMSEVPARIVDADGGDAEAIAIIENVQRVDLSAWEEASAAAALRDRRVARGESATGNVLASRLSRSSGWVSERLTIADGLSEAVRSEAGVMHDDLARLSKSKLLLIARISDIDERIAALRVAAARENDASVAVPRESITVPAVDVPPPGPAIHRPAFTAVENPRRGGLTIWLDTLRMTLEERAAAEALLEKLIDALRTAGGK